MSNKRLERIGQLLGKASNPDLFSAEAVAAASGVIDDARKAGDDLIALLEQSRAAALAKLLVGLLARRDPASADDVSTGLLLQLAKVPDEDRADALAALATELLASWPRAPTDLGRRIAEALGIRIAGPPQPPSSVPPPADGGQPTGDTVSEEQEKLIAAIELDIRGLPPDLEPLDAQKAYKLGVFMKLAVANGGLQPKLAAVAYASGKLLRTGQFDASSSSFASFVRQAWGDLTTELPSRGARVTGIVVAEKIIEVLAKGPKPWSAQQLAFIYEAALETLGTINPSDPGFVTKVDAAYLDYASGETGFDGFQLPALDESSEGDLLPVNILTVGRLYGAYEYERLRLIPVVERITELWRAGVLPIANDSAGRLLDEYFWSREDRLTESGRGLVFGRVFGATGTETSKDSQQNKGFEQLLRRFLTNVAQLRRLEEQQNVIANPGESRLLASENARKTGRELATNLSLYGWGSAYYDAGRIDGHLAQAFRIVSDAQVQRAFAATTPSQVIERVAQQELGVTTNLVKHETMARSGRAVIEIIARNPQAFTSSNQELQTALGKANWDAMSRHALAWLSVNGVTSEQLVSFAAPVDGIASPSLPTMPSAQPGQNMNQLRELVSSGKMPSLDQLQRIFN